MAHFRHSLFLLTLGLSLAWLAAGDDAADAKAALIAKQPNLMAKGLPMPKNSLACTDWSWFVCYQQAKGVFKVGVNDLGGGGLQAPQHYLNGEFSLQMQLTPGNSGGVNYAWYLMDTVSATNKDPKHSEIDVEFYGNTSSKIVMLALNVFAQGKQNLAQYSMPFDVAAQLHTYTIRWSGNQIVWLVDGVPLRILNRKAGDPWPLTAMKPMASVWATPWTALKADFTNGPIFATYANYKAQGCLAKEDVQQTNALQCPGTWNNALTPAEMAAYQKLNKQALLVEYGWDKIN